MKRLILKAAGLAFCILPPVVAILSYFPIWVASGGEVVISGFALLLLTLAMIPLWKTVKRALTSPASYTLWLIAFIAFFALSNIARDMTVISFVGLTGNLLGAVIFKLADRESERKENEEGRI